MIGEAQFSGWRVIMTSFIGLMLAVVPLPHALSLVRPDFLLLITIYWSLTAPRTAGLFFAWMCGFAMDVMRGIVLGQHAFAFLAVATLTHHFQLRMRIFPIWQQTFAVFLLLLVYQLLLFWTDGLVGAPVVTWFRWLPMLTGALIWPVVVATLDTWNRRRR